MLDPLGAIASLIVGFHSTSKDIKQKQAWFNFGASIFGTAFVSFFGTWGITGPAVYASTQNLWVSLVLGFFAACLAMATSILLLWKRSDLTKGIPILAPMKVEEEAQKTDTVLTERR